MQETRFAAEREHPVTGKLVTYTITLVMRDVSAKRADWRAETLVVGGIWSELACGTVYADTPLLLQTASQRAFDIAFDAASARENV